MTTAIAKQIGNSQKEQIVVNGNVFIKSAPLNKWQYVIEIVTEGGTEWIGKSATRENAEKWTPTSMNHDYYRPRSLNTEWQRDIEKQYQEAVASGKGRMMRQNGHQFYRVPIAFTRKVTKIER